MSEGLGIFCGLCDKYYPDIQSVEEHTVHTIGNAHWLEIQKFVQSELREQIAQEILDWCLINKHAYQAGISGSGKNTEAVLCIPCENIIYIARGK